MPDINYVSQTAGSVSITYADMPAATEVVYVNTTSGAQTPSGSPALNNGGSGKAAIPIDTHWPRGSTTCWRKARRTSSTSPRRSHSISTGRRPGCWRGC